MPEENGEVTEQSLHEETPPTLLYTIFDKKMVPLSYTEYKTLHPF